MADEKPPLRPPGKQRSLQALLVQLLLRIDRLLQLAAVDGQLARGARHALGKLDAGQHRVLRELLQEGRMPSHDQGQTA